MSDALLLDTHALLWWVTDFDRVPPSADAQIRAAERVYVSAASAWEIRTKYRMGKLPEAAAFVRSLAGEVARNGFRALPITFQDGDRAGAFAAAHKDPFDRMLAAQAINHGLALVSNDAALDAFGIVRIW